MPFEGMYFIFLELLIITTTSTLCEVMWRACPTYKHQPKCRLCLCCHSKREHLWWPCVVLVLTVDCGGDDGDDDDTSRGAVSACEDGYNRRGTSIIWSACTRLLDSPCRSGLVWLVDPRPPDSGGLINPSNYCYIHVWLWTSMWNTPCQYQAILVYVKDHCVLQSHIDCSYFVNFKYLVSQR